MDEKQIKFRKQLGAKIQQLRENKNLKQADLAALIGFKDFQSVSRIENGRVTASVYTIYLIANALEVGIEDLVFFD
ncbi:MULTISPECIES: helix-turn-helix domain-containing protein [unclassified Sphingobacterium]|uniref:helix-turn-helix domain-containing protein n=1 Tax=unclassified Sphingobacterium TaxID=2609468 RepID=UPI0010502388|nr:MULTISPECIES: helix-turn-helix transcriptional regulator [unclassified Sphingobacterium]MCS3555950.1 transcriptional regulator with XRE-family HTH domain [Sphingobacterium sp. JUb21]TCR00230.1 DNA-binding XRE family transcriptional regulator [Sphingobacterium sp. JUb20]